MLGRRKVGANLSEFQANILDLLDAKGNNGLGEFEEEAYTYQCFGFPWF